MKKALLIAVFLAIFSAPLFGDCAIYYDSRAYSDWEYTLCWMYGAICYNCYDINTGDSCASNWEACDPYPKPDPVPPILWTRNQLSAPSCQKPPVLRHSRMLRLRNDNLL